RRTGPPRAEPESPSRDPSGRRRGPELGFGRFLAGELRNRRGHASVQPHELGEELLGLRVSANPPRQGALLLGGELPVQEVQNFFGQVAVHVRPPAPPCRDGGGRSPPGARGPWR